MLTRISIWPKRSRALPMAAAAPENDSRSARIAIAVPPAASASCRTSSTSCRTSSTSGERSIIATWAPFARNAQRHGPADALRSTSDDGDLAGKATRKNHRRLTSPAGRFRVTDFVRLIKTATGEARPKANCVMFDGSPRNERAPMLLPEPFGKTARVRCKSSALQRIARPNHRAPHLGNQGIVKPETFLRLPEMPANHVFEIVDADHYLRIEGI